MARCSAVYFPLTGIVRVMSAASPDNAADLMPPPTWKELDQWATDLQNTPGSVGVLCSGQSLLSKRANSALFNVGDAEMPNYSQFDRITVLLPLVPEAALHLDAQEAATSKIEGEHLQHEEESIL